MRRTRVEEIDLRGDETTVRVLVVDADVVVPMMLAMRHPSLQVLERTRLADALAYAVADQPDVVVVDRNLIDGDGLTLVRALRRHPRTRRTPIIVTTGDTALVDPEPVLRAGADGYIVKPFDGDVLEALVRRLLLLPGAQLRSRRQRHVAELQAGRPSPGAADLPALPVAAPVERRRRWGRRPARAVAVR